MRPDNLTIILSIVGIFLINLVPVSLNATPLNWTTGVWGDTWQSQQTSTQDSDGDGVVNLNDAFPGDNSEWGDFDSDGIGDNSDIDDDNDGIDDYPDTDDDNDGLTDLDEILYGTDRVNKDTDGDGLSDGDEVKLGRNPLRNEPAIILMIMID